MAYLPIDPRDLGRRYRRSDPASTASQVRAAFCTCSSTTSRITLPRWLQIDFSRVVQTLAEQRGGEVSTRQHPRVVRCDVRGRTRCLQRLAEYDVRKTEDGVRTQVTLGNGTRLTGLGRGMVAALADALAAEAWASSITRRSGLSEMALERRNRRARNGLPAREP